MPLVLYQFPVSHYCEKIRWALSHKGLEYRVRNLLPGRHVGPMTKLSGDSAVPVLVHDGEVIANSSDIITYLDETFPERSLTPDAAPVRAQAEEWERFADDEVGVHVRLCCYHILLEYPAALKPMLTYKGPWYGPLLYGLIFPAVRRKMRALMKINERTFQISKKRLERAIDRLAARIEEAGFLAGDRFSRADLAAASMLAPLACPERYAMGMPVRLPDELEQLIAPWRDRLAWVSRMYDRYR